MKCLLFKPSVDLKAPTVRETTPMERTGIQRKRAPPIQYPFWFGGSASGMAACVTHPLDLRKSERVY
jgi:hypothetical protein